MQSNLVSVVISLYNKEKQIVNTLKSLLSQSYDFWECIIVDDGSTDLSLTVLEEFIGGITHHMFLEDFDHPKAHLHIEYFRMRTHNSYRLDFLPARDLGFFEKLHPSHLL